MSSRSSSTRSSTTRRRWFRRLGVGVVAVIVVAVAGPFIYIHFVDKKAPPKLSLQPVGTSAGTAGGGATGTGTVAGAWSVTTGSLVGYRVDETLVGQKTTAVGRTAAVDGTLVIRGASVTTASFTAQMATVKSNESERDDNFRGRIMDVARYPTATFSLTKAIDLASVPAVGVIHSFPATGSLTLRGQTHPVTFTLSAERTAAGIEVQGEIPVLFATWGVPNPSVGGFVTTADHGTLEFLLRFAPGTATASTTTTPTTTTGATPGGPGGPPPGGGGPGGGTGGGIKVSATTTPPLSLGG